jgi:hypothetical protein
LELEARTPLKCDTDEPYEQLGSQRFAGVPPIANQLTVRAGDCVKTEVSG